MVRPKTYDIYLINCPYGKYIGTTEIQLKTRWCVHKNKLKRNVHPCKGMQKAYNEGFEFEEPEVLLTFRTEHKASCRMAERYYQLLYSERFLLMNTRIEKEPKGILCKQGRIYLSKIKQLQLYFN